MYTPCLRYGPVSNLPALQAALAGLPLHPMASGRTVLDGAPVVERFQPLLATHFPKKWARALLVALHPNSLIPPHGDTAHAPRHHIPLVTDDRCWSFHAGVWSQLQAGHVYDMDAHAEHGSVNWGSLVRVHLILDTEH